MKTSNFWVKKSRVKVTVGSRMPQNALFGLVVVTCWRRHNSQWCCNHHPVYYVVYALAQHVCCLIRVRDIGSTLDYRAAPLSKNIQKFGGLRFFPIHFYRCRLNLFISSQLRVELGLGVGSYNTTPTITIYYYLARQLILIYYPVEGRRLSRPSWLALYRDGLPASRQSPI